MSKLTTVMYHYVRPIKQARYTGIKGLEYDLFVEQIKYLVRNYNVISMEEVCDAFYSDQKKLPPKAALLTFDDAYLDHFLYAYPVLKKYKIQGSFFAPQKAVCEGQVLDVNKIHFILSVCQNSLSDLLNETKILFDKFKDDFLINQNFNFYQDKLAIANRFDLKEVIFFKRLLQVELPEEMRIKLTDVLFEKYIGVDQVSFSKELYMNKDHVIHMVNDGMHFGSHGSNHYWWDKLDSEGLDTEMLESKKFLLDVGMSPDCLTVAYPYGAYNEQVLSKMSQYNYKLGLTTKVDIANLNTVNPFEIPRLDTNDLPKTSVATKNEWLERMID
jgi:peptidoglycan/xylan/chitin deacetylase (PgdA/CDA1 family)